MLWIGLKQNSNSNLDSNKTADDNKQRMCLADDERRNNKCDQTHQTFDIQATHSDDNLHQLPTSVHSYQQTQPNFMSSCPSGCTCSASTVDCTESKLGQLEVPSNNNQQHQHQQQETATQVSSSAQDSISSNNFDDDVPIYVTKLQFNDSRIRRLRQNGIIKKLANSKQM